jgi:phage terminase small subunit
VDQKLTPKQAAFLDEYLVDLNGRQAAIRAGYAPKAAAVTAAQLLTKPNIRAEIEARKAARAQKTGVDAAYVLRQAKLLHERCMDMERFDPANSARSLEIIGKHVNVQAFNEKSSVSHTIDVSGLPDSELDAIIQSALKK